MYQIYSEMFKNQLSRGMSSLEVLALFEDRDICSALRDEKRSERRQVSGWPLNDYYELAMREERHNCAMARAFELWKAGWTNIPFTDSKLEVKSWHWRAPAIGHRSKGRLFPSTWLAWKELSKRQGGFPEFEDRSLSA